MRRRQTPCSRRDVAVRCARSRARESDQQVRRAVVAVRASHAAALPHCDRRRHWRAAAVQHWQTPASLEAQLDATSSLLSMMMTTMTLELSMKTTTLTTMTTTSPSWSPTTLAHDDEALRCDSKPMCVVAVRLACAQYQHRVDRARRWQRNRQHRFVTVVAVARETIAAASCVRLAATALHAIDRPTTRVRRVSTAQAELDVARDATHHDLTCE